MILVLAEGWVYPNLMLLANAGCLYEKCIEGK